MSKGWDSKSVEQQQAEAAAPKPANDKAVTAEEAHRRRRRQSLELQRERILSERTSSPHRRSALEAALIEIEMELSKLGWSLHV
jgi:hypothetical protein